METDYKKRYEEAFEKARELWGEYNEIEGCYSNRYLCEEIFPALKESEDERIRGAIIDYLKDNNLTEWADWLEKQGEQNKIEYVYPKFRIGDIIEPIKPNGSFTPVRIKYIGGGDYRCKSDDGNQYLVFPICRENEYKLVEQKPAWSEEDESLCRQIESILSVCRIKSLLSFDLYKKMLDLLRTLKDRVQPQSKQEWSEEDKTWFDEVWRCVSKEYPLANSYIFQWLKSLRPQNTWKPSEEQMDALQYIYRNLNPPLSDKLGWNSLKTLELLYNDLKKLREK